MTIQAYPHHYRTEGESRPEGTVRLASAGLPALESTSPPEFGGPEGYWSPETLLLASLTDCYILSFRAVARASKLEWVDLRVEVQGVLDRVDGVTRFTHVTISPRLQLTVDASETLALTVLKKSKSVCLISNSLNAQGELVPQIVRG